jgi:site-specific recombinase XerD
MATGSLPTRALTVITEPCLPVVFAAELELASDFAKASKAKSTQAAYSSDFRIFDAWCRERGLTALPAMPATVCAFLATQAGLGKRASTLSRRLAAIGYFHRLANEPSPVGDETIKATLSGIRRSIGAAPVRKKAATSDIVLSMTGTLGGESLRQLRDRAILLIGFASAMRRSELVALNVADLEWTAEGVMIRIARSKTDQECLGQSVAVPRGATACPVAALKAWIEASGIVEGAVFRRIRNKRNQRVTDQRLHGRAIAVIVKKGAAWLRRVGLRCPQPAIRACHVCSEARRKPSENLRSNSAQVD